MRVLVHTKTGEIASSMQWWDVSLRSSYVFLHINDSRRKHKVASGRYSRASFDKKQVYCMCLEERFPCFYSLRARERRFGDFFASTGGCKSR